jgi:hypothetical protein
VYQPQAQRSVSAEQFDRGWPQLLEAVGAAGTADPTIAIAAAAPAVKDPPSSSMRPNVVASPARSDISGRSQRDVMRELVRWFGRDEDRVVMEYAAAEERGEVQRSSRQSGLTSLQYAKALWADAMKKGWL